MNSNCWLKITDSNNNLILESIAGNSFSFIKDEIKALSKNPPREELIVKYKFKEDALAARVKETLEKEGANSRRVIVSWISPPEVSDYCIALIQLLQRENLAVLNVYLRASDSRILPSDLGFFSRLSLKYSVDILQVFIGSLHIYL